MPTACESSTPRIRLLVPVLGLVVALGALVLPAASSAKPKTHQPKTHKPKTHKPKAHKTRKPSLGITFVKPPTLTEGTQASVSVRVVDKGRRPLRKVVVAVKAPPGVEVTPVEAKLKVLRPHKAQTLAFGVTVAAGTSAPSLAIVGSAKGIRKSTKALALKTVPAPPTGPTAPLPNGIAGRYFFNSTLIAGTTYVKGYYFVDQKFVYRGIPKGGLPTCTEATAQGDGDGCLPYTYESQNGILNVAGVSGEFQIGSAILRLGEESFSEAVPVAAGTKVDASGNYINGYGICPYCTFVSVYLELTSSGSFAKSSAISGSTPESEFAALPPDQHGTYTVDTLGHVVFTYADGHVVTDTFAFLLDGSKNPDPNYGMLLDDQIFFGPHSDV